MPINASMVLPDMDAARTPALPRSIARRTTRSSSIPGDIGTFAGLQTDASSRVLDKDGRVISGLYAAGNDAASVMGGTYPGAGITIGPALTFGYIAGRHVAAA